MSLLLPDFGYVANTLAASGGSQSADVSHAASGLTSIALALTGQFAHIDSGHLLFNLIGLWLVCWGFKPWRNTPLDLSFLGAGLFGVAAGLLCSPDIAWYKGLSGALHGLFWGYAGWVALTDERWGVKAVAVVLLAGAAVKLVLEDPALSSLVTEHWSRIRELIAVDPSQMNEKLVLYAAHRWGALAGLLAGMLAGLLSARTAGEK